MLAGHPSKRAQGSTPHGDTHEAGEEGGERRGRDDEPVGPAACRGRGSARQLPRRVRGGEGRLRPHLRRQEPARAGRRQEAAEGLQAGGRRAEGGRQRDQAGSQEEGQEGRPDAQAARARDRRRDRAGAERGPALEGTRRAVRQGGGVRLRLHRSEHAAVGRHLLVGSVAAGRLVRAPAGRPTDYDRTMAVTTPPGGSSAPTGRPLESDKAKRIVDAMRESVAARGAAGSTFDHVAREAGVSRGLLHYYFGTKERLLGEVVRRDSDLRLAALDAALASAHTAEDLLEVLVRSLEGLVERDPAFVALHFELFTSARRTPEIAAELGALHRRIREHVAAQLDAKRAEGVIAPGADPEAVVTVLLSLADGLALRMLADPEHDWGPTLAAAMAAARALLT